MLPRELLKSGSSLLLKMYSYSIFKIYCSLVILYEQKASSQYFVFFAQQKRQVVLSCSHSSCLLTLRPQPKWPNRLPLIGSWFPASATSSYIFLTINLNSYQSSHSWHSGNTYVLWSLPWSLHLEVFTPFCQFLLLYQSGSSQKNNPLQLFYQREFNQEFV